MGRALWASAPLLLVLSSFVWCTNTIMVRGLGGSLMPVQMAFWRMVIACAILLAFNWHSVRRDTTTMLRHWRLMLVLGATGIGGFNLLLYIGLQSTTALHGVLLQSVIPFAILVVSALLYREVAGPRQILAILVSTIGVAVIVSQGSLTALLHLQVARGDAFILLAVLSYGFYPVLLRRLPPIHPMSFLFGSFLGAGLLLAPPALWEALAEAPMAWTWTLLWAALYLAAGPAILAYLGYYRGVVLIGPARAGQYVHLIPVFGSILAVLFLGERFQPSLLVGIALIAAGLLMAGKLTLPRWRRPAASA